MKETLKTVGGFALGVAIIVSLIFVCVLFVKGGVWLSERVLPVLSVFSGYVLVVCLLVLVPLAVFESTRGFAAGGLFIASYVFGISLWMTGLLLTYTLWGVVAVIIGLLLCGVGVVPMALLATLFKGLWGPLGALVFMLVATYGSRFMALYVIEKRSETTVA